MDSHNETEIIIQEENPLQRRKSQIKKIHNNNDNCQFSSREKKVVVGSWDSWVRRQTFMKRRLTMDSPQPRISAFHGSCCSFVTPGDVSQSALFLGVTLSSNMAASSWVPRPRALGNKLSRHFHIINLHIRGRWSYSQILDIFAQWVAIEMLPAKPLGSDGSITGRLLKLGR